jgi:alkylation response protein AidB-like acyl-CoA dehydrogenase
MRDDPSGFGSEYWTDGAKLGWTSLLIAEGDGGGSVSGRGLVDLTTIAFEFGRHASPGPLLPTNVVGAAVSLWGNDELKALLLPGILSGDLVAAWAVAEPRPNDRLGRVACTAIATSGSYRLNGIKAPVEAAQQAQQLLVTAVTSTGLANFVVPTDAPGLTIEAMGGLDVTRRYASVQLTDVEVPPGAMLRQPDGGLAQYDHLLHLGIVVQLAEMVGAIDRCLEMTVDWAFNRYSFGRPLASYQELKHRFADMRTWLEAAHAIADAAADHVQDVSERAGEYVSAGKAYLGVYGLELAQDCVQIHGGIGVTFDHDLHLYLRRVVLGSRLLGTVSDHRQRLTTMLQQREISK